MNKKLLIFSVLAILFVLLIYRTGLNEILTLENLKNSYTLIYRLREDSPYLFTTVYVLVYVFSTAFSVPGAVVLSLAGGAFFGLIYGTLIVSICSSIGALLAFWVSRYFLNEYLKKIFPVQYSTLRFNFSKNKSSYLLSLRLAPVFPFFLINLLMGLMPISSARFFFVSQIGMLPATIVYVNAGLRLSEIDNLSDIASPSLLIAFACIAFAPYLLKKIVFNLKFFKSKRVYIKPTGLDYDLIVIGAGAAGLVSTYIATLLKAKVLLIEKFKMGGDCLNTGCVPSKSLISVARENLYLTRHTNKKRLGLQVALSRVKESIDSIKPKDSLKRYIALGADVVLGTATIVDPWSVNVIDENSNLSKYSARSLIVSTGASPYVPEKLRGFDYQFLTSDSIWNWLNQCDIDAPSILFLGGGAICCELAQALSLLGCSTTLALRGSSILNSFEPEVSASMLFSLSSSSVSVLKECEIVNCVKVDHDQISVDILDNNAELRVHHFNAVFVGYGRRSSTNDLGLESLGFKEKNLPPIVSNSLQTEIPSIFICGDARKKFHQSTHSAANDAYYAVINALFRPFIRLKVKEDVLPSVVFTSPEVAHVGISEKVATQENLKFEPFYYSLADLDRSIIDQHFGESSFIKIIVNSRNEKILGATIVSERAGEMIGEFSIAMKFGLTINDLFSVIHPYPSYSEGIKLAIGAYLKSKKEKSKLPHLLGRLLKMIRLL